MGDLLPPGCNKIPTRPRRQVADDRGLQIDAGFMEKSLPRLPLPVQRRGAPPGGPAPPRPAGKPPPLPQNHQRPRPKNHPVVMRPPVELLEPVDLLLAEEE